MKQGLIYLIRCEINQKVYIGQTLYSLNTRWSSHRAAVRSGRQTFLYSAMRKYGVQHFTVIELEYCSVSKLDARERYYIKKYRSNNEQFGYNQTPGGWQSRMTKEIRAKISATKKGVKQGPMSEAHREAIRQGKRLKPYKHSARRRRKIRLAARRRFRLMSPEERLAYGQSRCTPKRYKLSVKTVQRIRKLVLRYSDHRVSQLVGCSQSQVYKIRLGRYRGPGGSTAPARVERRLTRVRSNNRMIRFRGRRQCLAAWSEETGLPSSTIRDRLAYGWSVERALTTPKREK